MADPTPQSFRIAVGQAKTLGFTDAPAQATDASGWDLRFRMRSRGGVLVIEKTPGDGVTFTGDTDSVQSWDVAIGDADTGDVPEGVYDWSFWRTDDGSENPKAYGSCEVYATAETG